MKYAVAYTRFEVLRAVRNRRYLMFTLVMPVILYLLFSGEAKDTEISGIRFAAYFAVSMVSYAAIGSAFNAGGARLAAERASGWTTQVRITPLSTIGYIGAKVATAIWIAVPGSILVGLTGIFVEHVHLGAMNWVQLYLTVWLALLPFAALAMAIGYAFDTDSAQAGTMAAVLLLSFGGGLWAPITSFPTVLRYMGELLPSYQMADAARAALHSGLPNMLDVFGLVFWTVAFGALFAWFYRREISSASA